MNKGFLYTLFAGVLMFTAANAAEQPGFGFNTGKLTGQGGNGQKKDINGFNRAVMPDDYLLMQGGKWPGVNLTILCPDNPADRTSGSTPVTQYRTVGDCPVDALRLSQGLGITSKTPFSVPILHKKDGNGASLKNAKVGLEIVTPTNGGVTDWSSMYSKVIGNANNIINDKAGTGPLVAVDPSKNGKLAGYNDISANFNGVGNNTGTTTGSTAEETDKKVLKKTGEDRAVYSTRFSSDKEVVESGACQLIEMPGKGRFNISPLMDGTNKFNAVNKNGGGSVVEGTTAKSTTATATDTESRVRATNKDSRGDAVDVDVEVILDPTHPFAPRNNIDWTDRLSPSATQGASSSDSNCNTQHSGQKYNYTCVCGHKKFGNDEAWKQSGASSVGGSNGGKAVSIPATDFGFYSKPMQKDGYILVDTARDVEAKAAYSVCYEALKNYVGEQAAQDACELLMCKTIILPPVEPANRLKMAYNLAPDGPGKSGGATAGAPSAAGGGAGGNSDLPFIYEENRKGHFDDQLYETEGFSWYFAHPADKFGYNMPPLKHWPNGLAASKAVVEKTGGDRSKWEPWREAIVGGNKYYMANETNEMEEGAHNMSAQYGGWNELKLYQARCASWFGLNCICDYEKNFGRGTQLGYVLFRAGKPTMIDSTSITQQEDLKVPTIQGYTDFARKPISKSAKDKTTRSYTEHYVPSAKGKYAFQTGLLDHLMEDGAKWPGKMTKTGLNNAKKDDIIIFDAETSISQSGIKKRPVQVAYVEEVLENKCIRVTQSDNGSMRDSYEVTENWSLVTERVLCPGGGAAGIGGAENIYDIDGFPKVGNRPSCTNVNVRECTEEDWNAWRVYSWKGDKADGSGFKPSQFDSRTGRAINGGSSGSNGGASNFGGGAGNFPTNIGN